MVFRGYITHKLKDKEYPICGEPIAIKIIDLSRINSTGEEQKESL